MVDVAMVRMFDLPVGTFRWDEQYEIARFEYDHSFIGRRLEPSPLMMPVREGRIYSFAGLDKETFKGLPGMLADSLPDTYGRALFDRWLALTGRTSSNPVETLCFLGKRCMGALEFEPAMELYRIVRFKTSKKERRIQWMEFQPALIGTKETQKAGYVGFIGHKYGEKSYLLTIPATEMEKGEYGIFYMSIISATAIPVGTFGVK